MPKDKSPFIYGRLPILELLKDGQQADRIFIGRGIDPLFLREIRDLSQGLGIPVQLVPKAKLDRITRKNHQGVIAMTSVVEYQDLEALVQLSYDKGEVPLVLMLDGVTDVRNIGGIARSAEVFGVTALVLPLRGSAALNEDAVKTSAGALRYLNVARVHSLGAACRQMQNHGLKVLIADHHAELSLEQIDLLGPTVIVMGSEHRGVDERIQEFADGRFTIPQTGRTESLNVSVATGVILYELTRQRKTL